MRLEFPEAATAVSINKDELLSVGLEDGSIHIYRPAERVTEGGVKKRGWNLMHSLKAKADGTTSTVTDMKWHPQESLLAICSSVLQIFKITTE